MSDSNDLFDSFTNSKKSFEKILKKIFTSCSIETQCNIDKGSEFDEKLNELLKASFAYYATKESIPFIPVADKALSIDIQNYHENIQNYHENNNNFSYLLGVSRWRLIYGDLFLQPLPNGKYVNTRSNNDSISTYTLEDIIKVSTGLNKAFFDAHSFVREIIFGVISENNQLVGNNFCAKELANECLEIFTKKTSASQNKFLLSIHKLLLEPDLLNNLPTVGNLIENPALCELFSITDINQLIKMYHIDKLLLEPGFLNNLPTVGELLKNPALCQLFSIIDINQKALS